MSDMDAIQAGGRLAVCNCIPLVETIDGKSFQNATRDQQNELAEYLIIRVTKSIWPAIERRLDDLPDLKRKDYISDAMEALTVGFADGFAEFGLEIDIFPMDMGDQPHE